MCHMLVTLSFLTVTYMTPLLSTSSKNTSTTSSLHNLQLCNEIYSTSLMAAPVSIRPAKTFSTSATMNSYDFGISAEWHFFAASHGKGACDGMGEQSRNLRQKLVNKDHIIITSPHQCSSLNLHQPTFQHSSSIFSTTEEYYKEAALIASRLQRAKTIAGTQKLHFFKPLSLKHLEVALYSTSSMKREEVVTAQCDGLSLVDVKGYVTQTAIYDGQWWLAYVTDVIPADEEAQLNFLHPHGPSPSNILPMTQ